MARPFQDASLAQKHDSYDIDVVWCDVTCDEKKTLAPPFLQDVHRQPFRCSHPQHSQLELLHLRHVHRLCGPRAARRPRRDLGTQLARSPLVRLPLLGSFGRVHGRLRFLPG